MNKKENAASNRTYNKNAEMRYNAKSQIRKMKEEIGHMEEFEDVTKYGEFVSSYFAWIGLNRQKNRADELNEMTRKKYTSKKY